eukprot:6272047-Prymnesium_polylepis.1
MKAERGGRRRRRSAQQSHSGHRRQQQQPEPQIGAARAAATPDQSRRAAPVQQRGKAVQQMKRVAEAAFADLRSMGMRGARDDLSDDDGDIDGEEECSG